MKKVKNIIISDNTSGLVILHILFWYLLIVTQTLKNRKLFINKKNAFLEIINKVCNIYDVIINYNYIVPYHTYYAKKKNTQFFWFLLIIMQQNV